VKTIWYLVKFFTEERHANAFLDGDLFLNRLSHFRQLEQACDDGRADPTEAVSMWWQPHDIFMSLAVPGIGTVEIGPRDLAGPMSIARGHHDHLHVLCMYAIYTSGFTSKAGELECDESQTPELMRQLDIDSRCLKFGSFAVIVNAAPFLNQVKHQFLAQGYRARGRLVEYYDDNSFHGEFPDNEVPFMKQVRFKYQNEFRLAVTPRIASLTPITINIGSIRGLSAKLESSRLSTFLNTVVVRKT